MFLYKKKSAGKILKETTVHGRWLLETTCTVPLKRLRCSVLHGKNFCIQPKGVEFLSQTLIFLSLYLCISMPESQRP